MTYQLMCQMTDCEALRLDELRYHLVRLPYDKVIACAILFFKSCPRERQISCLLEIRREELTHGNPIRRNFSWPMDTKIFFEMSHLVFSNTTDSQLINAAVYCLCHAEESELASAAEMFSEVGAC